MHFQMTGGAGLNLYAQPVSSSATDTQKNLRTGKEIEYDKHKLSMDLDHVELNYFGLCQGKLHQVGTKFSTFSKNFHRICQFFRPFQNKVGCSVGTKPKRIHIGKSVH